jgi:hypothetical protein
MTPALDTTPTDAQGREVLRSPGLGQFRKSPFRMLRLPLSASAKQAVWQCDKALARMRVGMALPDPDPVPWLPAGDEIELQEAAQTMESPLARMVEQLLWFDPADDPGGAELLSSLSAGDGRRLHAMLAAEAAPSVARRINAANLRLLLGFSQLHEIGPAAASGSGAARAELSWQTRGGLSLVEDPHSAVRVTAAPGGWAALLGDGVVAWGGLLASPKLADHVRGKIAALGDELLTADDLEVVISGIRTRIADLIVGETKLEIAEGRIDSVSQLSAIAGRSKIDAEIWLVAFRPLKTLFESELAELAPDAETGLGVIEDVSAYLDRLATLAQRWRPIDEAQLLGLSTLIDDAVQAAFARLRGAPREAQLGARFGEVLARIGEVAHSPSVRERVKGYKERLADVADSMCHFCGRRQLEPAHCAAVTSKLEISRQRYGNQIRVQYQIGALPVARCQRCALLHGFIRGTGVIAFGTLSTPMLLLALVHPPSWFRGLDAVAGGMLLAIGVIIAVGLGFLARPIAALVVTPRGERRIGDYLGSKAIKIMHRDGFYSFRYDSRPNAWELVTKHGAKHRHGGGNVGAELRALFWVGLIIIGIAARACAH